MTFMAELKGFFNEVKVNGSHLFRWFVLAAFTGSIVGVMSVAFHKLDHLANTVRTENYYLLFGLPIAGLFIVFLYYSFGVKSSRGTNLIITTIQAKTELPIAMAPLIFVSTIITHLFGGSVGREGAALQLGGALGAGFGRLKFLNLSDEDKRVVIMCGMSAAFSAIFGTPIAAVVFPLEVISIGIIQYSALFPCFIGSLTAHFIAGYFGIADERLGFITDIPLDLRSAILISILAIICGLVSIIFCMMLKYSGSFFKKLHPNKYVRVFVGGCIFVFINVLLGTTDYLGAGMNVIERAVESGALWYAFIIKMVLTALCIGVGYKGGEIVPSLFIGATIGSSFASFFGLPLALGAACGMAAVFVGVTNAPLSTLLIISELFGFRDAGIFFLLAITISYLVSGYFGLYSAQTIIYSKFRTKYINRKVGAYDPDLEEGVGTK